MKGIIRACATIVIAAAFGASGQEVVFKNEASDTIYINELLSKASKIENPNERVLTIAKEFLGKPYVAGTLEGQETEKLVVNLDEVDCTTLIDNVMAICISAGENRLSWRDFVYTLEKLRYRGGKRDGYASRLHYVSDWVVDNTHRGNFNEVTNKCDLTVYDIKSLNFITQHADAYPALADSATFATMKRFEEGYRNHRFPVIKSINVGKVATTFLKPGDIIAFTTSTKGLDVSHFGIIVDLNGKTGLLHASSKAGKVVIDKLLLTEYLTKNRSITGIRVFRLNE